MQLTDLMPYLVSRLHVLPPPPPCLPSSTPSCFVCINAMITMLGSLVWYTCMYTHVHTCTYIDVKITHYMMVSSYKLCFQGHIIRSCSSVASMISSALTSPRSYVTDTPCMTTSNCLCQQSSCTARPILLPSYPLVMLSLNRIRPH